MHYMFNLSKKSYEFPYTIGFETLPQMPIFIQEMIWQPSCSEQLL